ncbi:hypothetical protein JVU11DRAFT_5282 [Chiua virens]|nr:hypothetical protein JVU11DRAFT_5282 [Chiua virens]
MAVNLLLACTPATSCAFLRSGDYYQYPYPQVWLFFSAFLAFIAALQDLGQTLANGFAVNTIVAGNESAIRAREILFAFAIGSRFLFYWSYVAEPPRKDLSAASTQRVKGIDFLMVERTQELHSGSWIRWGLPGKLLGAGLLTAIIIITALQVVWRVVHQFHQYSAFYATDTVLELLVSVMLLLKLLSNTITPNSPNNMPVHTFSECLAPASGLLVNITVGVGNLLSFAFTESTVGRLLQAFEIYIIVVFVVVIALLRHRDILLSPALSRGEKRKDILFTLPEPVRGSTFRITPPVIETPHMSMILSTATQGRKPSHALRRSVRRSLNHISSWVSAKISRQRSPYEDEEVVLWNAEKLKVDPPNTGNTDTEQQASIESVTQRSKEWSEHPRDASADCVSIASASNARPADARPMEGSICSDQILGPSGMFVSYDAAPRQVPTSTVPTSSIPSSSKYAGSMTTPPESSPIYGLGGIRSVASPSNSQTSLDELLRQQSQLDESIQALKLFSKRTSANSSCSKSVQSPRSVDLSRSSSIGQRTVCSEVSLSHFPIPPWLTTPTPSLPPSFSSTVKRVRGVYPKASASLVDIPGSPYFDSIPYSPLGEENEPLSAEAGKASRSNFERTQYNVTSLIGGLATPGEPGRGSHETLKWSAEREPGVDITQTDLDMNEYPPHVSQCPNGLLASPAVIMQYRGNEHTSRALPISHSPQNHVTGLTMTTASREEANRVQRTFVRPRPPPLALQLHTVQNFGTRVQLVADD